MPEIPSRLIRALKRTPFRLISALSLREQQEKTLRGLLRRAANTRFGLNYGFKDLADCLHVTEHFAKTVPLHTYETMFDSWWKRSLGDEPNVCWPETVPYFARSSGTAGASSKYIPVTFDMVHATNRVARKQLLFLRRFGVPLTTYRKQALLLGSTTSLKKVNGHLEGDLSGICARHMPSWLRTFYYKPGESIISEPEWNSRLELMVKSAWKWDIGTVCGVPSWVQILLQQIRSHYKIADIHQIWPNFNLYIHGGVSIVHYKDPLGQLFGKQVAYMETYMASEGSFGFQAEPGRGIRLVGDAGIFFEFIPFNNKNFDQHGNPRKNALSCTLGEVREGEPYAVVLSTCSGAWRYLIGDVVKFTNASLGEISVAGRTKQYLDHCGEHVSVDNLTQAVLVASRELGMKIGEFGVCAEKSGDLYAHHWFVGCDDAGADPGVLARALDGALCKLNDDYAVERKSAIKEVKVSLFSNQVFNSYHRWRGKEGDMIKFPRVLKGENLALWNRYLNETDVTALSFSRGAGA